MESTRSIITCLDQVDFLGLVDIKDVWLYVSIFSVHQYLSWDTHTIDFGPGVQFLVCTLGFLQSSGPSTSPAAFLWHPYCRMLRRPSVEGKLLQALSNNVPLIVQTQQWFR